MCLELLNINARQYCQIAAYDPTTPFKVVPVNQRKTQARSNKPDNRGGSVAGPSSKPASGATGTKRKNNKPPEPSDSDDLYADAPAEDDIVVAPPEKKAKKGQDVAGNGKATSKGKGKAKAEPPPKTSKKAVEPIEVDDVEVIEETEADSIARPSMRGTAAKSKKATSTATRNIKTDKELSRLREKLVDVRNCSTVSQIAF